MKILFYLTLRNLRLFFRDRTAVFFSILSVFVIIGVNVLFLADIQVQSISWTVGGYIQNVRHIVDTWIISGVLAVISVTVTLGALGIMVHDAERKILRDFLVAPVKRGHIMTSYILCAFIVGVLMSIITFMVAEAYLALSGWTVLPLRLILKCTGIILLCVFSSSAFLFFIVSFLKTYSSFTTLNILVGTLIGFAVGMYVPLWILPETVSNIIKALPIAQGAALFRQTVMKEAMDQVFAGAPQAGILEYKKAYGLVFEIKGYEIEPLMMVLILAGVGILFSILSAIRLSRYKA